MQAKNNPPIIETVYFVRLNALFVILNAQTNPIHEVEELETDV